MYFVIAGLTTVCVVSMFLLPETKDVSLEDKIDIVRGNEARENEENSKLV